MKNTNDTTPPGGPKADLSPREAATWFGYKDVKTFLRFCVDHGVPLMRHNKRVIRFDRNMVDDWRQRRGLGLV